MNRNETQSDTPLPSNLGYMFTRNFYRVGGEDLHVLQSGIIKKKLKAIIDADLTNALAMARELQNGLSDNKLQFKTKYPGLLVGSGYAHGQTMKASSDGSDEDVKNGCSFDYTLGLPVIPGSEVKGMLHNCFRYGREKVVLHVLNKEIFTDKEVDLDYVEDMRINIFEGDEKTHSSQRDIFYDALPVHVENKLLGFDYITPHKDDPLKNPVPIKLLRVEPDVTFDFRFRLIGSSSESDMLKSNEHLTIDQKLKLFQWLIELWGIGAKTRVGYGNVEHLDNKRG